jgi:hypothetical protein
MPAVTVALDAVRAELGEPDTSEPESPADDTGEGGTDKRASGSADGDFE